MSTQRIVFIVVCVILSIIFIGLGIIFRNNDTAGNTNFTKLLASIGIKRRKKTSSPKNTSTYFTIFLVILALFLILYFNR